MSKFSIVACTILGIGLIVGPAPGQGIGGAWVPGYYGGYYPFGSAWAAQAELKAQSAAARREAAQISGRYQATVDQRTADARAAGISQINRNAAKLREINQSQWAARQAEENELRLAEAQNRALMQEREAIARGVTGAWKQYTLAGGGTTLPTDLGGVTQVAEGPASHREPVTHAIAPAVQAARGADVRAQFRQPSLFTTQWFQNQPAAWKPAKWAQTGAVPSGSDAAWHDVDWAGLIHWLGWNIQPIRYDYGVNIKIHDGVVFRVDRPLEERPLALEADYYGQALALAQTQPADPKGAGDWLPLGVFALVREGQTDAHAVLHLAINKAGMIGGNYYNTQTKQTYPLHGAVDKATQRVAGMPGGQQELVFEAGLYNLTLDTAPVLVFFAKDNIQQWLLVQLKLPEEPKPPQVARLDPSPPPEGSSRASIEIRVPADADLWFDGYKSSQMGPVRKFSTPPLKAGQNYAYDIRARWTVNGAPAEQTRTVVVQPGERARVEFPAAGS
jgi:uncharacterized protein (TIGR03000 family)